MATKKIYMRPGETLEIRHLIHEDFERNAKSWQDQARPQADLIRINGPHSITPATSMFECGHWKDWSKTKPMPASDHHPLCSVQKGGSCDYDCPREYTPPAPNVEPFQARVAAAHHALFHDDPTDVAERLARFAEEANETCQSLGMTREDAHALVDYTYDRPTGDPAKEIGSALLTLASLCVVAGYDLMACGEADLQKLQRPETIVRIRAKRATRHGRGPLPGLSPASEGQSDA